METTARILTLIALTAAPAASACRFGVACERWIAPRDGATIPSNTLAFVAGSLDAGLLRGGTAEADWFLAGELTPGSELELAGTDCQGAPARSQVTVGAPAPLPTWLGEVSLEETARDQPLHPCDEHSDGTVTYRMVVEADPLVLPWLPVGRFQAVQRLTPRTARQTLFGEVTANPDGGALAIESVTLECSAEPVTLRVFFEVAGVRPVSTDLAVETPCRPGCSASAGASTLVALVAWWRRRRGVAIAGSTASART